MKTWILYFDGACEPVNPGGTASYGWLLFTPDGHLCQTGNGVVCRGKGATNNVAEYAGLEAGLTYMLEEGIKGPLVCKGDSQLVVYQVTGKWRCHKPHLEVYRDRVRALLNSVSEKWSVRWIPRTENTEADYLSKLKTPSQQILTPKPVVGFGLL